MLLFWLQNVKISYTAPISISNGMTFDAALVGSTQIKFTITAGTSGWVGFGYGTCMCTNDMFVIEVSAAGTATINDYTMNYHSNPNMDAVNDYTLSTVTSGSTNTYTVTRLLNDGDANDYVFKTGTVNIVYAWGSTTAMNNHGSKFGSFSIVLNLSTGTTSVSSTGSITTDDSPAVKHGVLLYIAWGWLCFFLIVTGRYSKYFYFVHTFLHVAFALLILLFTLIGVYAIKDITAYSSTSGGLTKEHKSLGYALTYLCISAVGIGIISKVSMLLCRYLTFWVKLIRFVHAFVSYIVIAYSQYVILTGLYTYNTSVKALYFVQMAAILVWFVAAELSFYIVNKKYYNPILTVEKNGLRSMTLKAFYESDKKLALFNDYIVDLTSYAFEHPGGTYMIQQCNKKDIGKYMYGAFSMENRVSPHRHSFIAMLIIEKLVVAKLVNTNENIASNSKSSQLLPHIILILNETEFYLFY